MKALPFLDANILLRHLRQDHPDHSPRATALLKRIEQGQLQVHLSDMTIAETVFTLQRFYKVPKAQIAQALLPLINLPTIKLARKKRFATVFDFYARLNLWYRPTEPWFMRPPPKSAAARVWAVGPGASVGPRRAAGPGSGATRASSSGGR